MVVVAVAEPVEGHRPAFATVASPNKYLAHTKKSEDRVRATRGAYSLTRRSQSWLVAEFVQKSACLSKKTAIDPRPFSRCDFRLRQARFHSEERPMEGEETMIYIRLRNRQESGFRNYFFTHERLASQYSLLFSRRKTSTFWNNSIRQLTRLLPRIERLRFGQNRGERNA